MARKALFVGINIVKAMGLDGDGSLSWKVEIKIEVRYMDG
jgi:hypothetical protein